MLDKCQRRHYNKAIMNGVKKGTAKNQREIQAMQYTYKDLIEKAKETEFHDVAIEVENHRIFLRHDSGCLRRYWTVYIDGQVICTRCKFDNGVRIAAKALNKRGDDNE